MDLAVQDSIKCTAMLYSLVADMLNASDTLFAAECTWVRHLTLWTVAIHDMCHEC